MEKNETKVSLTTVILLFIIFVLVVALGLAYYFGFVANKENTDKEAMQGNNVNSNNQIAQDNKQTQIPTTDLVTLYYEANSQRTNVFYAYIENGYLYYFRDSAGTNGNSQGAFTFMSTFALPNNKMVRYSELNNIKRIKTYNIGTGIKSVPFLITEAGEVYTIDFEDDNNIKVELYEGLKDFKIENIISKKGEVNSVFELLLKDGTTKTVTVEL